MDDAKLHPESIVVAAGRPSEPGAPLNTPIVPVSAYRHAPADNFYARHQVAPTVAAFEAIMSELEGGTALAFASGMAAISAAVAGLPAGAVVVVPSDGYSGMTWLFREYEELGRLTVRRVDVRDLAAVSRACDGAELLWIETVANPLMTVADVPALAAAAHAAGALLGVDATFSTPLVVRPLDLGADLVMHSVTKYLAGHSDALMGVLSARSPDLAADLQARRGMTGGVPGVLEAFLATRGVRTLALRMERAQGNADKLATRLASHDRVARVRYPGLAFDPGHEIAARDHAGFGAMIGIELDGTAEDAERVCESVRLINHATSLGGVESLIERRARYDIDAGFGTPPNLLRLSVGIEHVEDLWADLAQALDASSAQ
jgi:cystathionine gamma-synthase